MGVRALIGPGVAVGRIVATIAAAAHLASPAWASDALWPMLGSGGYVVLIRHASTEPGVGDPPNFRLDDCATQRNLSQAGRDEARRLGEAFRARGIPIAEVLSSEWCRCRDTALLAFGRYAAWPPLNSFFGDRSTESAQTRVVRERAAKWRGAANLVIVTHQVNIAALAGVFAVQGEIVVLKADGAEGLELVGTIRPPG
jgi:phosphohistidine phosphatase SixA